MSDDTRHGLVGNDFEDAQSVRDPIPLKSKNRSLLRWLGPAISFAVLCAVLLQLGKLDMAKIIAIIPTSPLFWIVFALSYLVSPIADWIIFNRLWKIPLSGLVALMRKQVGNEILLGYIGDLYFYDWARKHAKIDTSPFGAVKDVAILSALVGNVLALIMVALSWPLIDKFTPVFEMRSVVLSLAMVLTISLVVMLFRKRLFSLETNQLVMVAFIHLCRTLGSMGLTAFLWYLVLPNVALSWWLLSATIKIMISRLPLLPNKELVFAGIAVFLVGHDVELPALMAMLASLILATHVLLGATLMILDLIKTGTRE